MSEPASVAKEFAPRILEIGPIPYMHTAFPSTTDFYSTWPKETINDPARGRHIVSAASLPTLVRRLADSFYDLIAVQPGQYAPWSARGLGRAFLRRSIWSGSTPFFRFLGPQLLRGRTSAPVMALDLEDPAVIDGSNGFLLDKADLYFKRELPADHWMVFGGTLHWRVPTHRFRSDARQRRRLAKLRPIALGVPFPLLERPLPVPLTAAEKRTDVFFAGLARGSSSLRERGLAELLALRAEGWVIDAPEQRLPPEEFMDRCARAWIVWSPPGYGWQCFRTSEAALCGSVPLMSRPPIEQYRPLVEGKHALYYDVEPGGLTRAVRVALADRVRLMRMAAAAREHVLAWYMPQAMARHMAEATLQTRQ